MKSEPNLNESINDQWMINDQLLIDRFDVLIVDVKMLVSLMIFEDFRKLFKTITAIHVKNDNLR